MAILQATEKDEQTWEALPAGIYPAKVNDIIVATGYQANKETGAMEASQYLQWKFDIMSGMYAGRLVWGFSSTKLSPQAKARPWVEAILGKTLAKDEQVDTADLVGLQCVLTLGIEPSRKDPTKMTNMVLAVSPPMGAPAVEVRPQRQKTLTEELEAGTTEMESLGYPRRWLQALGKLKELYGEGEEAPNWLELSLGEKRGKIAFARLSKEEQEKAVKDAEGWAAGEDLPL